MSIYTDVIDNLEVLKLDKIKNMLPEYLDEMKNKNISFTEMLYDLTKEEIKYQTERAAKVNITVSAFPFEKTINDFDLLKTIGQGSFGRVLQVWEIEETANR